MGSVLLGGGAPVAIQSMLSAPWQDTAGNIRQAEELQQAGCQILRVSVPTREAVALIDAIKSRVELPLVADIHFDYRLAVESVAAGADKIRINPGNIGGDDHVKAVADICRQKGVPIRVGVNSGSLEAHLLERYGHPCPEALVESALEKVQLLNRFDFDHIVLSLKSSSVRDTIAAYRLAAQRCDYPLHLGVTEAGTERMGIIKSAVGIGSLLADGIGDTIRVSLTADPVREVYAAKDILRALDLWPEGAQVISCPTCGRTQIDLIGLAHQVEERLRGCKAPIKVAVMGCVVNGPGEAREADFGVAGGRGCGVLFQKGQIVRKVEEGDIVEELAKLIAESTGEAL